MLRFRLLLLTILLEITPNNANPFFPPTGPESVASLVKTTVSPGAGEKTSKDEIQRRSQEGPFNVVLYAGADSALFFLPRDGQVYDLGNLECFALP